MNIKLSTVLVIIAATRFAAIAAPSDSATLESHATRQENSFAITKPFIVTAHYITSRDVQLKVTGEPDVRPLHYPADQALAHRFQAEFKANGFEGNVDFLSATDTPIATLPLLEVNLMDWRATPGELADCEFSATLVTPKGTTALGNFEGISYTLGGARSAKTRVDTLRDAATHAVDEVYRDLEETHMLSGTSQ